jgi:hypothetical protein
MRIQITGDRLGNTTNNQITSQVRGADNVLVPGVLNWAAVATRTQGTVTTISADITTEETVSSGDYAGTLVTQEFVSGYILGAAEYWLGTNGDLFLPSGVVFPDGPMQPATPAAEGAPTE